MNMLKTSAWLNTPLKQVQVQKQLESSQQCIQQSKPAQGHELSYFWGQIADHALTAPHYTHHDKHH